VRRHYLYLFFVNGLEMSKAFKPSGAAYRRLKTDEKNILTKHAGSMYAHVKKAEKTGKVMIR